MNKINFFSHNWLASKINNDCVKENFALIKGRVVDLGCGTAPYKEDILKVADDYIGVDWENSFHDQSKVDVFAHLSKRLPFSDEYAGTVVSFQVMEHLAEPEWFLKECHRILKHGGGIFFTVPFMWHVHEAPHDYYRYTRFGLTYLLEKAGFVDIKITENTGFWQTWILKFNYHATRYARGPLKYIWIPIWWLGQVVAPILDRYDNNPNECASYTVTARKP
jgi:SAM-dependent methyltransferase